MAGAAGAAGPVGRPQPAGALAVATEAPRRAAWAGERLAVAGAAIVVQAALGAIYAWSVFRDPLVDTYGWSVSAATLPYTLNLLALGFAGLAGGLWMQRIGPRRVMLAAALLYGGGVILCGLAASGLWVLYLGYGIVAGIGRGLAWVVPVATVVRWFPRHRGTVTGLAIAGNGLGGLIVAPLATALIHDHGVPATFVIIGTGLLVVLTLAALLLRLPPSSEGQEARDEGQDASGAGRGVRAGRRGARDAGRGLGGDDVGPERDYTVRQALRTWQWYALWALLLLNGSAGLGLFSQAAPMARELTGIGPLGAASIVGAFSLANALGRFGCAWLSDLVGRRAVYLGMFVVQAGAFLALPLAREPAAFTALGVLVMLCFGGGVGTMPAFAADYFGARRVGEVMGLLLTAQGFGAILGPLLLAGARDLTGAYELALGVFAVTMAASVALPLLVRPPSPLPAVRG